MGPVLPADGNSSTFWVLVRAHPTLCCHLQEFQNATDDVFGQLLSAREAEKEQSAGPPDNW
jgi:hypothetical protein